MPIDLFQEIKFPDNIEISKDCKVRLYSSFLSFCTWENSCSPNNFAFLFQDFIRRLLKVDPHKRLGSQNGASDLKVFSIINSISRGAVILIFFS